MSLEGVSPQTLCVDALHTLYLGPARDWLGSVFWLLINEQTIWKGRDQVETATMTMLTLRNQLTPWYGHYEAEHPDEQITRVENLEPNMLGPRANPQMSTKAAETKSLIPFGVHLLQANLNSMSNAARPLLRVGEALLGMVQTMRTAPRVLPPSDIQRLHDDFNKFVRFWGVSGLAFKPKMHLLMHLIGNASHHGNPGMHTTFHDEGLNRVLAQMGRVAHRRNWELRVLAHFIKYQSLDRARKLQRTS